MRSFLSQSINPMFEKILSLFLLFDYRAMVSNNRYEFGVWFSNYLQMSSITSQIDIVEDFDPEH
jgi:phosphate starvation-inducible membrane PsiE